MRHQFLLASMSAIALTGSAFVADFAPPPPPPVPIFTWTGAYIGGQIGYAWSSGTNKFSGVDPYSGVAFVSSVGQTPSGVIGGANIGYNYQINQWVIGVEGSVDGTSLSNTGGLAFPDGTILAVHSSTDVQGSIRGRVGIAWDRALIFATGGVAFGGFNTQYNYDGFGAASGRFTWRPSLPRAICRIPMWGGRLAAGSNMPSPTNGPCAPTTATPIGEVSILPIRFAANHVAGCVQSPL